MNSKILKKVSFTCLGLLAFGLVSCGGNGGSQPTSGGTTSTPGGTTSTEQGGLSITLNLPKGATELEIKDGAKVSAGQYWTIKKEGGNPTSAEKKVLATSDDESVVTIAESSATANPTLEAKKPGTANVTVKLNKDNTKQIVIPVVVTDAFFDYELSNFHDEDNLEEEMPDSRTQPGGKVEIMSSLDTFLVIKGSNKTDDFYLETEIVVGSLDGTDDYPKVGLFAADLADSNNAVRVFFDTTYRYDSSHAKSGQIRYAWDSVGTVEVSAGTTFGWQLDYPNNTARHTDCCVQLPQESETIKLAMVRKGQKFHVFCNDQYKFTWSALDSIAKDAQSNPRSMYAGLWSFPGVTYTMQNYMYSNDNTLINSKMQGLGGGENIISHFDPKTR